MHEFVNNLHNRKINLLTELNKIKAEGKSIVGYGAPAKATTLLTYFGVAGMIDYIVDDSPLKQGRYMPGNHLPIFSAQRLYEEKPDYVIVLAWNFADSIRNTLYGNGYRGKVIIP